MEFRILGPLEVRHGTGLLPLGGRKQRALLGVLLLNANRVVAAERLIDEIWGDRPPESAAKLVQGYVSGVRRLLGGANAGALETQAPGYVLRVGPDELDLFAFERLVAEARAETGQPELAADRLRAALALWRGPALADVSLEGYARQEAERLNERRLTVHAERIELDLALGRHADLIGELETLIGQHPLQERLRGQLMLALYRSGRQSEALRVYQQTRRMLVDELGLDPSQELQSLERRILAHDPQLDLARPTPAREAALEPAPEEHVASRPAAPRGPARVRKTVTVVFSDVVEWSTLAERLDPESLHQVQARYHEETAAVFERHGGTVEKFIGDAAVAVFGVPVVHEDDALRAVRAAAEALDALHVLNEELERDWGVRLTVHTGVNTGEVVTGPLAHGRSLAAGDTVIVAARLQQAAPPGQIILGPDTYRLVKDSIRAETLEPLQLKGRAAPVPAWRFLELLEDLPLLAVPTFAPLVGRARELGAIQEALSRAIAERACRVCTVVGPPGIGKSRLVRELAAAVDDARVVMGRCLPYGEGITYWPLVEILKQVAGPDPRAWIAELLREDERATLIAERIAGALGLAEAPALPEETFWAVRKVFEQLARESPLIVAVDDVHWAEPTLLDLLEYLVGFSSDAPIVLLCLARPELLDHRPSWATPRPGTGLISLEPLSHDESRTLVEHLSQHHALSEPALERVVAAAEGNPLFLEQLHALQAEPGGAGQPVPPSIQALLAARIDRLAPDAREVLERASIEGRTFHLGALAELLPGPLADDLGTHLMTLVRKEFIRSDRAGLAGEEAFRFRHILIRDAAYGSIPKQVRAELHERFAAWLERRIAGGAAEDELIGYHLEQAFRHRETLGRVDERDWEVARRAARRLGSAGRRAHARGDVPAAAGLLDRAVSLLPAYDPDRVVLLPDVGVALREVGRLSRAQEMFNEAIVGSAAPGGDRRVELNARVELASLRMRSDPQTSSDELLEVVESAIPELEELGDEAGLARAWYLVGLNRGLWRGRYADGEQSLERALTHAQRAHDRQQEALILGEFGFAAWSGPTSITEATKRCERILEEARGDRLIEAGALRSLAALVARLGDFAEARELIGRARMTYEDIGARLTAAAAMAFASGDIELLANQYSAAERELRAGFDTLADMGETGYFSSVAAFLAEALYEQGQDDEAEQFTRVAEDAAATDDVWTQILFRTTRAKVLARRGLVADAESLARRAVELAGGTDALELHGNALLALAEVLRRTGRTTEAARAVEQALGLYEQKGNLVLAARARSVLQPLVEA